MLAEGKPWNTVSSTIGVRYAPPELCELDFRRDALLFDKVAVPMLGWQIRNLRWKQHPEPEETAKANELEWLVEQGIIFEPPVYERLPSRRIRKNFDETDALMSQYMETYCKYQHSKNQGDLATLNEIRYTISDVCSRLEATLITEYEKHPACPILYSLDSFSELPGTNAQVLQIIFENIPTPDPVTPWERIIDYRNDPETKYGLAGLRTWVSEVVQSKLAAGEIRDRLAWELETYERYMSTHKLDQASGTLEVLILAAGEILENLARLKFGKVAKTLFSIRRRHLEVVKAELKAPGRELAYISRTQQVFKERKK